MTTSERTLPTASRTLPSLASSEPYTAGLFKPALSDSGSCVLPPRRSLRKVIEESKRDAAVGVVASVCSSKESTPTRSSLNSSRTASIASASKVTSGSLRRSPAPTSRSVLLTGKDLSQALSRWNKKVIENDVEAASEDTVGIGSCCSEKSSVSSVSTVTSRKTTSLESCWMSSAVPTTKGGNIDDWCGMVETRSVVAPDVVTQVARNLAKELDAITCGGPVQFDGNTSSASYRTSLQNGAPMSSSRRGRPRSRHTRTSGISPPASRITDMDLHCEGHRTSKLDIDVIDDQSSKESRLALLRVKRLPVDGQGDGSTTTSDDEICVTCKRSKTDLCCDGRSNSDQASLRLDLTIAHPCVKHDGLTPVDNNMEVDVDSNVVHEDKMAGNSSIKIEEGSLLDNGDLHVKDTLRTAVHGDVQADCKLSANSNLSKGDTSPANMKNLVARYNSGYNNDDGTLAADIVIKTEGATGLRSDPGVNCDTGIESDPGVKGDPGVKEDLVVGNSMSNETKEAQKCMDVDADMETKEDDIGMSVGDIRIRHDLSDQTKEITKTCDTAEGNNLVKVDAVGAEICQESSENIPLEPVNSQINGECIQDAQLGGGSNGSDMKKESKPEETRNLNEGTVQDEVEEEPEILVSMTLQVLF